MSLANLSISKIVIEILKDIDRYKDDDSISKDQRASYVYGSMMSRDGYYYEDIIILEPLLEELTEKASDLEITKDCRDCDSMFLEMVAIINQLKVKYKV